MKIITIFDPSNAKYISSECREISLTPAGLNDAKSIAKQLTDTLLPLMPAAGLAASQIGILKQIFIYSWNRLPENIEIVLNPKIVELSRELDESWEACFSTISDDKSLAALVSRSKEIKVKYFNLQGKMIKQKLSGFAAKVFQHEYDHLQGIENVRKPGAIIKTFTNKADLINFMNEVKKGDCLNYVRPA